MTFIYFRYALNSLLGINLVFTLQKILNNFEEYYIFRRKRGFMFHVIHMKYEVLFSPKTMAKYSRLSPAAVVIGALRVKHVSHIKMENLVKLQTFHEYG